jgi:hypothetical protein
MAAAGGERCERCAPAVLHAPLCDVAGRPDRKVDVAIDDPDTGAAVMSAAIGNHGE